MTRVRWCHAMFGARTEATYERGNIVVCVVYHYTCCRRYRTKLIGEWWAEDAQKPASSAAETNVNMAGLSPFRPVPGRCESDVGDTCIANDTEGVQSI